MKPYAAFLGCLLQGVAAGSLQAAEFECMIESRQVVEIRTPVDGILEKIPVERGDRVVQGQVVAVLESGQEEAAHNLARTRAEAEAAIKAAEARVRFSSRKADRMEELYKQNFISSSGKDEAVTEKLLAEAQLREATEGRNVAQIEEQRAAEVLKERTVRSPLTGVVVERNQSPGELAQRDSKKPIMKLATLDPLNVEVVVPASQFGLIRVGMKAEVIPEVHVGGKYSATVKIVDQVIDAPSGTFGVRLELPNPKHQLPAGIKCKARFAEGRRG